MCCEAATDQKGELEVSPMYVESCGCLSVAVGLKLLKRTSLTISMESFGGVYLQYGVVHICGGMLGCASILTIVE